MTILPFLAMYVVVREGYIYAIMVCLYAFCLAFSSKTHCILHHFTLRLAPKRTAFSGKTHCILHQNALRLAAYCSKLSGKRPLNGCKWRFLVINIHLAASTGWPLVASKQTLARIDFLRPSGQLVNKKALIVLKFLLKSGQKQSDEKQRS